MKDQEYMDHFRWCFVRIIFNRNLLGRLIVHVQQTFTLGGLPRCCAARRRRLNDLNWAWPWPCNRFEWIGRTSLKTGLYQKCIFSYAKCFLLLQFATFYAKFKKKWEKLSWSNKFFSAKCPLILFLSNASNSTV